MSATHTPGPWHVESKSDVYPGIEAENFSIVIFGDSSDDGGIRGHTREETFANANLIAAAPDLLAALEGILAITNRDHVAWDKARAAIKKAKGETL